MSQRRVATCHPRGWVDTEALKPKRRRGRATGLNHFEVVTDMQGPLIYDAHDDRSPACNPEGAFNLEYER
jgi:hypothetical protein